MRGMSRENKNGKEKGEERKRKERGEERKIEKRLEVEILRKYNFNKMTILNYSKR